MLSIFLYFDNIYGPVHVFVPQRIVGFCGKQEATRGARQRTCQSQVNLRMLDGGGVHC